MLPLLDSKPITQNLADFKHVHAQMTFNQCQLNLMKWFDGIEGNMSIHNDVPHFYFSLLCSFFIEKWPDRLSLFCETIGATTIASQERHDRTMRNLFTNGFRQHHSLDDARVMLRSYREMETTEAKSSQYIRSVGITHLINSKTRNSLNSKIPKIIFLVFDCVLYPVPGESVFEQVKPT